MGLPVLFHLQSFVLAIIAKDARPQYVENVGLDEIDSEAVLRALRAQGVRLSGPAFYQLMARLQKAGLVTSRRMLRSCNPQPIRVKFYKITRLGTKKLDQIFKFYDDLQTRGATNEW